MGILTRSACCRTWDKYVPEPAQRVHQGALTRVGQRSADAVVEGVAAVRRALVAEGVAVPVAGSPIAPLRQTRYRRDRLARSHNLDTEILIDIGLGTENLFSTYLWAMFELRENLAVGAAGVQHKVVVLAGAVERDLGIQLWNQKKIPATAL